MSKTPFNWVGNKYKFIEEINQIIKDKEYNVIMDVFMGSGNILFNVEAKAEVYIGNDKIKLLPNILTNINKHKYKYDLNDIERIINKFNRFSKKEDYYIFRDYWNNKYLSDNFDRDFIMETILLLKMCSNSMVRFNPKEGYFNQGFRGLGKKSEFFTSTMKQQCVNDINLLSDNISLKDYRFTNRDFKEFNDNLFNSLLIFDPPYLLRSDMYDTDWSLDHEQKLNNIIKNTKNDFIYFNYIERQGVKNQEIIDIINENNLKCIDINSKTLAGQGRSKNIIDVKEVIITNIK